jgi:pSer/pThr/pTyr-binding forkhead associated (FHA) protein
MIICPSCQHEEMYGTLFCSQCGTQLTYLNPSPTKTAVYTAEKQADVNKGIEEEKPPQEPASKPMPGVLVSLRILDGGTIIPLEEGFEFTLGRVSGNQPILPDIDLTPYQAYEGGVSRLHATIKIDKQAVTVTDLGSANGTRVNGRKVTPHTQQSLHNEDILMLGKFKIQVLIHV